jgi:hypothetical protein
MKKRAPQIGSIHRSILNRASTNHPIHDSPKYLRRAGKYKFDHLDKTKDLSASSASEAASRSHVCAGGGTLRQASLSLGKAKIVYPHRGLARSFFKEQSPFDPQTALIWQHLCIYRKTSYAVIII